MIFTFASFVALAEAQPAVGVKAGEWMEYHVLAGGSPPAAQDITWAKIEILDVEGEQFHANFTVRYVNGTIDSSVRTFNFTAGNVQAWIIIPANLSPGESFYDSSINSNVAIQGQIVKKVAEANRIVTYSNSNTEGVARYKEWDKATGFYIQSDDNVENSTIGYYTINANAYATNIWSPQILGIDQTVFYSIVAIIIAVVVISSVLIIAQNRKKS